MKQSDWLRSFSERAGFLHPARSETQLHARCEMSALVFAAKTDDRVKQCLQKNLPKI
jgi:hypothetical protein